MPNSLAPGVHVEEGRRRARSIEGTGTGTAAFIGPTRGGPIGVAPAPLKSMVDFERVYGGAEDLELADVSDDSRRLNFIAHAARAFFDNGGTRLYVARTARNAAVASGTLRTAGTDAGRALIRARWPGAACNGPVLLREVETPVALGDLAKLPPGSLLAAGIGGLDTLYVGNGTGWLDAGGAALAIDGKSGDAGASARLITLSIEIAGFDRMPLVWSRLGLAPAHPRWIDTVLGGSSASPLRAEIGSGLSAFDLIAALRALPRASAGDAGGRRVLMLTGGSDGDAPVAGDERMAGSYAAGLAAVAALDDVATVAAPGSSAWPDGAAIRAALVAHAGREARGWRIAVLDSAPQQSPADVRELRASVDSSHAALYYPWVIVADPASIVPREIALPPSGFVAGIYARTDAQRGVHKAPANELVHGALRFERDLGAGELELLNPAGVNCLRELPGRGLRLWGARLASSDPQWQYVPTRRYIAYLEASIDRGTQWVVFEPNDERLWASVRHAVHDFLIKEWRNGALLGAKQEEAFFVRCDRTTMTQAELDAGRLLCLVGVAILKPAEFVMLRVGRWTADAGKS